MLETLRDYALERLEARGDEQTLRRNADLAASIGVQLFVVDLGWSRSIGDWSADPAKFPSGLAALSDYVHSLGMKFGLHFALAEADPKSPVLRDHPEWSATDTGSYFGATPLCLSNKPTQEWLIQEAIRMIVAGFFQQVFDRITIESVREALGKAIGRRIREYD